MSSDPLHGNFQIMGRVHHNPEHSEPVRAVLNSAGRALADGTPLFSHPIGDSTTNRSARLVDPPRHFDKDRLSDLLIILMANVEQALLESGAKPGIHYSRKDLLQAATPFVVSMFEAPSRMYFITEWPDRGQHSAHQKETDHV